MIGLSRQVPRQFMAVDQKGKSIGNACFASGWYDYLTERVNNFIKVYYKLEPFELLEPFPVGQSSSIVTCMPIVRGQSEFMTFKRVEDTIFL